MSLLGPEQSTTATAELIEALRSKGVRLWSENGQLHYRAKRGALAQDDIERLRSSRDDIVATLERCVSTGGVSRANVPLAFSQLAHWNLYRLGERRSIRQVTSATRIYGRLNLVALRKSLAEVVQRHESLRTRVIVRDGVPEQKIDQAAGGELKVDDLSEMPDNLRRMAIQQRIERVMLEPIDVAIGPLFETLLVKPEPAEHVFIMAMEHMISDGFSLNILARDVFTSYAQVLRGLPISLPPVAVQFPDFAIRQRKERELWEEKHRRYWEEHLAGCDRVRFPERSGVPNNVDCGWDRVPIRIGKNAKLDLREWCRSRRTTLVMGVLTAYIALVLRWCDVEECVIQYQSDGRVAPELENTIGYLSSVLYLRVGTLKQDCFVALLSQIQREYCSAYEHADFAYISSQMPRPQFTRNTLFNWVPNGPRDDFCGLADGDDAVVCSPFHFGHPILRQRDEDREPGILLYDTEDEIVGVVNFPRNRFSPTTMQQFAQNFSVFLQALIGQPTRRVKDIALV